MCKCFYQKGHYAGNKLLWNRWLYQCTLHLTILLSSWALLWELNAWETIAINVENSSVLFLQKLYEFFSHTDFTASILKCGYLPGQWTTFPHNVSSENQNLKFHANTEEVPIVCDMCGMTFTQLMQFQTHSCTHMEAKHTEQEVCNVEVSGKNNQNSSVSSNTQKNCLHYTVCKDGFPAKSILKRHILTHAKRKPLEF